MLNFISPKILAVLQIIMALGIFRFWFIWFRTEHKESWLPAGYMEHEEVFVYPDSVMSILMIIAAVLLFMDLPLGQSLTLVCGGMMLFLTVIDIAYFAHHGLFAPEKGGRENWGLVFPMILMSALMIFRFL
ncbi:hypothetical protein ACFL27_06595 [candidate division CSSED10-310 bacterium]|uniref:DoxX family protein n=1 Tax=candidate division CSSED10-310 bacterium TaxID=2855610 RepID=A0ABV6YUH5_UNCC1